MGWTLGILGLIGLVLYLTILDAWRVPGDDPSFNVAVAPTLRPGDTLLILKSSEVKLGHLVRCMDPDAPGRYVVGRIIAKAGDKIDVDELVTVNGKRNPSPHACSEPKVMMRHPGTQEDVRLSCVVEDTYGNEHEAIRDLDHPQATSKSVVEAGKVYLVSDNRHWHLDSRDFGQVDPATCQHIVYRLWGESYFDASRRFNFLW